MEQALANIREENTWAEPEASVTSFFFLFGRSSNPDPIKDGARLALIEWQTFLGDHASLNKGLMD